MSDSHDSGRIICLSNVYDEHYRSLRGENVAVCLSLAKRRDLFRCMELATGKKVTVLSSPPKPMERRSGKWLGTVETQFSSHPQFFCANLDTPKIRIPLSWFFYALHVAKHVKNGDILIIDNYEFIYLVAARWTRLFRRVSFVLEYEDGKHLIERGLYGALTACAEKLGRPIIRAAFLAHPALEKRLPPGIPSIAVPGFVASTGGVSAPYGGVINLVYSGSLDSTRGVDLLLEAVPLLPADGWHLHITGSGRLADNVAKFAGDQRWREKVTFHGVVPGAAYGDLIKKCHVGLNCQRTSDPISGVTFPSKIFSYISAGLLVVSSEASDVPTICGDACIYYKEETPASLAGALRAAFASHGDGKHRARLLEVAGTYNLEGTAKRVKEMFKEAGLL